MNATLNIDCNYYDEREMCVWKKGMKNIVTFRQYLKDVSMGKHTFQRITFPWKNSTQQWDIDIAIYKQEFPWKCVTSNFDFAVNEW